MKSIENLLSQAIEYHSAGNLQQAGDIYMKILAVEPENGDANNLLGVLYHQTGNSEKAVELILKAIKNFPERFSYYLNLGVVYEAQRKLQEAKDAYEKALTLDQENPTIFFNLGNIYKELGTLDKAINSFKETIKRNPGHASAFFNLGNTYLGLNQATEATEAFEHAVKIDKSFTDAWIHLGDCYEKSNNLDEAQRCLDHLLNLDSQNLAAKTFEAKLLRRKGKFNQALEVLQAITIPKEDLETATRIHYELGRVYDRIGNADNAFLHFQQANQFQLQTTRVQKSLVDKNVFLNFVKKSHDIYSNTPLRSPVKGESNENIDYPIFLIGFPRSGTTLVGQILDSHPELQVMVERPVIDSIVKSLKTTSQGDYHTAVATMTQGRKEELQVHYFHLADQFITRKSGNKIIDQHPLNIVNIDLIQQIFPHAKIILVVRHPYDVCLSCLMQHFELNDAMANFTSLEDAAILYSEVMNLWHQYEKILHPHCTMIKYENLVKNPEGEIKKLLEFIGVAWSNEVLAHHAHTNQQTRINTPSYHQVIEPIYDRAAYRWKRYEKYFSKAASLLEPYIDLFGYSEI